MNTESSEDLKNEKEEEYENGIDKKGQRNVRGRRSNGGPIKDINHDPYVDIPDPDDC